MAEINHTIKYRKAGGVEVPSYHIYLISTLAPENIEWSRQMTID